MYPQSRILRPKLDEMPDILLAKYVVFEALFSSPDRIFYGKSVRKAPTYLNKLSPVSVSCHSVSGQTFVSYSQHMAFIELESAVNAFLLFSLSSILAAKPQHPSPLLLAYCRGYSG